ncbi:putative cysteine synthase b [Golovinomyces cichoracearum]|uniref:Putative cysteine synthase b n=1 Tax=Golovinomyces cichoracearum TaxID=62708 RepID=A0A420IYI1_9PEZI|nr:putative cysteine synthase b [Golovinomyces cichoracearum]
MCMVYHYDKSWEIKSTVLLPSLYPELLNYPSVTCRKEVLGGSILCAKDNQIWDLRTVMDFDNWHLPGAVSKPLMNLTAERPSSFFDTTVMKLLWWEMETIANNYVGLKCPEYRIDHFLLLCYNGETSRMATSELWARGIKAINLMNGMNNLAK